MQKTREKNQLNTTTTTIKERKKKQISKTQQKQTNRQGFVFYRTIRI